MSGFDASRRRSMMNTSRTASPSHNAEVSSELKVGARAIIQGKVGTIRFVGTTSFQTGKWIGIELDEPQGKNSGVVQGKRYFDCKSGHGVFVRPSQVRALPTPPEDNRTETLNDRNEAGRFAPAQDPNLAAARTIQLHTPSSSTTLLPSKITSPSRIGRIPPGTNIRKPTSLTNKGSASPTATYSTKRPSNAKMGRPRSGTQGSASSRDTKGIKLQQLRLSQQRIQKKPEEVIEPQSSPPEEEPEEEGPEEEEEEEEEEESEAMTPEESVSNDTHPDPDVNRTSSTVMNTVHKPTYGSLAASLPISKSEQMISLKEYEELRLKLKILESKRQEDRERSRENEKIKEEAEQFLTLRNKLQDKIAELQKELRETKKELKESLSEQEMYENKYNDVIESLEMMTLDKEVAEERAENLQQEVNVLKDKIEEISVDLDVLKKEADIMNRIPDREGDEKTPLEVIQLERHNERLKEALMRLRDATTSRENELTDRIKDLERDTNELEEVRLQNEKLKTRLDMAEMTIEDLKQRLDDALGAEDLVEQLTEKNLSLSEKIEEMHMTIDDLEALKELADELEENHIETEKQLEAEIDHRDMLLREQLDRLKSAEETNADYETTIQQFRELVTTLQTDLEQLRHKEVSQQTEKQSLSSQSQAMMSLNMQLQSTVMKAQAKSIDLELRKLDAAQANDRLNYISPYLPDQFFKTENDAISCVLLYKRLLFKAELIIKHLDQNYPISEKIMDTVTDSLVSVCEMRQRAGWLSDLSKRFVTFISHCQPATFTKMGQMYHDLVGTERRLTGIVDLLRTNELNEADCVVEIQRMIAQLEHLSEIHLAQSEPNHVDQFFGLTRALDLNADRMTVELTYVRQAVEHAAQEDIPVKEGRERLDYEYLEPLSRLISQAKNSKILAKKLLRQLEDLSEQALTLKSDYLIRFKTLYAISNKLGKFCYETYKQIAAYVEVKVGSKEEISLAVIRQMVYNKADEILEIAESSLWEGCLRTLKSLTTELGLTYERIQNDNKTEKIVTGVSPWIQRASDMKAEVIMNHDMERKLQLHSDEILKLIKDVKIKDQSLQESSVKIELLEKRMEAVKRQAEQITQLEESLAKSQHKEQMFTEALENLQAEFDAADQENRQLKKNIAKKEEKRLSTPKKAEFDLEETTLLENTSNVFDMNQQMEALKSAIRYLRTENAYLKGADVMKTLEFTLPSKPEVKEELRSFASETRVLVKDLRVASATPKLIKLSPERRGGQWQSEKTMPDYQYLTQQSVLYTLQQRCHQLKHKMNQLAHTPSENKTMEAQKTLAKIQLPALPNTIIRPNRCIQLQNMNDFKRIHNLFITS